MKTTTISAFALVTFLGLTPHEGAAKSPSEYTNAVTELKALYVRLEKGDESKGSQKKLDELTQKVYDLQIALKIPEKKWFVKSVQKETTEAEDKQARKQKAIDQGKQKTIDRQKADKDAFLRVSPGYRSKVKNLLAKGDVKQASDFASGGISSNDEALALRYMLERDKTSIKPVIYNDLMARAESGVSKTGPKLNDAALDKIQLDAKNAGYTLAESKAIKDYVSKNGGTILDAATALKLKPTQK